MQYLSDVQHNKRRILKHIRRANTLSRVELVDVTGLRKSTVTEITADLLRKGIIYEAEDEATGRGRPRKGLRIVAEAAYAVGLVPMPGGLASIDILNMKGERVFSIVRELALDDILQLPLRLSELIDAAIVDSEILRTDIRHVSIVLPAQMDQRSGIVYWLPMAAPHEPVALAAKVEELLEIAVTLDCRPTVMARAEHWFGSDTMLDDFTCIVLMEVGMGAARYVAGRMQIGVNGMVSELAHVKMTLDGGPECSCGGNGCLQTYASVKGILGNLRRFRGDRGTGDGLSFADAVTAARAGDGDAQKAFNLAGQALGTAVANHINEQDPGKVLILCAEQELPDMLRPAFDIAVKLHTLPAILERSRTEFRVIAQSDFWKGGAALALDHLYLG